jgi:hypothetical protein
MFVDLQLNSEAGIHVTTGCQQLITQTSLIDPEIKDVDLDSPHAIQKGPQNSNHTLESDAFTTDVHGELSNSNTHELTCCCNIDSILLTCSDICPGTKCSRLGVICSKLKKLQIKLTVVVNSLRLKAAPICVLSAWRPTPSNW